MSEVRRLGAGDLGLVVIAPKENGVIGVGLGIEGGETVIVEAAPLESKRVS